MFSTAPLNKYVLQKSEAWGTDTIKIQFGWEDIQDYIVCGQEKSSHENVIVLQFKNMQLKCNSSI